MRFDAKFTAVFAAGMLGVSLVAGQPVHAETPKTDASAKTHVVEQKKSVVKKKTKTQPKPVKVTVKPGDSLSSIAKAHHTTWVRIFNANKSVASPDAINPGQKLVIPTAKQKLPNRLKAYEAQATVVAQTAPAQQVTSSYTTKQYTSAPVSSDSYYVGNGMWCTDYVHMKRPDVPIYGNAGYSWIADAQAQGKSTGSTPRKGAIAVTNGHVAYVEKVNANGSYTVSEMGWNYQAGEFNRRTVSPGTFGEFIY